MEKKTKKKASKKVAKKVEEKIEEKKESKSFKAARDFWADGKKFKAGDEVKKSEMREEIFNQLKDKKVIE